MASTNANSYTRRYLPPVGSGNTLTMVSEISVSANPTANDTIKLFHEDDLRNLRLVSVVLGADTDMDTNGAPTLSATIRANDGSTQQNALAASTVLGGTTAANGVGLGAAVGYKFTGTHWLELLWAATAATFAAGTVYVVATFVRAQD